MKISDYTKYTRHINEYNQWNNSQSEVPNSSLPANSEALKKKAKTIAEPILLLDSYTHEKAEDSETFYQTLNTEIMSVTGLLCTLPMVITKAIPFLDKHAEKHDLINKAAKGLTKYKNAKFNIMGKTVSAPQLTTIFSSIIGALFFATNIKNSIKGQIGLIRKASFDATQKQLNDPRMFALLTDEQEKELANITSQNATQKIDFVDKLKDRMNIGSSFQSVEEYNRTNSEYKKQKQQYFEEVNKVSNKKISPQKAKEAKENQQLFENYLKNVEHDVLEPLRKVETMSNIGYSALFAGGFLEYLLTDKVVDVLKVKNKVVAGALKFGVPLITYLLLNKNISDFENKAILATKYKHLKQFTENPEQYQRPKDKKQTLPEFIKTIAKDMKDYDKFAEEELPKIKEKLEAKKQLQLTPEQENEATLLQKNTNMVINTQREFLYDQTVGIEVLSEIISNPIDILGTALGAKIGHSLSKKCTNKKLAGMMTAIGTLVGFIPIAMMEAKFTKEQKKAEKISSMLAIKNLKDPRKFADFSNKEFENLKSAEDFSTTFKEFLPKK